nr:hypothetical protein [Candidatus Levybacteria bacterium]
LMGWTHPEEKEIFSLKEFISVFDLKDMRQVGPIFDLTKLTWLNGEYIRAMDTNALIIVLKKYYATDAETRNNLEQIDEKTFASIMSLAQSRITTLKEFYPLITHFLPQAKFHINDDLEKKVGLALQDGFGSLTNWDKDAIMDVLRTVLKEHSIRMPFMYTIVTGQERGLPLPESLEILGKETVLRKLKDSLQS